MNIANSLFVVNEKCAIEWEGEERAEVAGTVDVFGPYSGGGDVKESAGDKKRHLSLQVSQKEIVLRRRTQGLLEECVN